jgi:predicted nucleic-acid-binding protein
VRTLDTNVVVRLLIGDDPQQTPIAERAFLEWSSMTSTR